MSAKTKKENHISIDFNVITQGIDRFLVYLLRVSVIALGIMLISETVRELGGWMILGALLISLLFTFLKQLFN